MCRTLTDHLTSCSSSSSTADRAFAGTHIDTRARTLRKQEGGGRCHGWWWWLVVSTACGCRAEAGVGTQPCWRRRMLLRRGRRVVFAWFGFGLTEKRARSLFMLSVLYGVEYLGKVWVQNAKQHATSCIASVIRRSRRRLSKTTPHTALGEANAPRPPATSGQQSITQAPALFLSFYLSL